MMHKRRGPVAGHSPLCTARDNRGPLWKEAGASMAGIGFTR